MRRSRSIAIVLGRVGVAGVIASSSPALALVRNDAGVGNPEDFPFAVKVGDASEFFCSGTLIGGGGYVITAQHCLHEGTDASAYRVMQEDGTALAGLGQVALHPTLDIAIIPLAGALTASVGIYDAMDEIGREIAFAGYGKGSTNPGGGLTELPYGTLRVGHNVLELEGDGSVAFDFDLAGGVGTGGLGDREATTLLGDSGMGYFIEVSPGLHSLLGVHSGIAPNTPNRDQVFSFGVRLSPVREWVMQNIPSPGAVMLGVPWLVHAARRRRRGA